jgi:glycosyltransferase involved in cell wall biosynthesis
MAAGNAVIASGVGGIPSAIESGVSGLLVPRADLRAFTETLGRLLADPELAHRLGAEARRIAGELFDIDRTARRFVELVMPLVRNGR